MFECAVFESLQLTIYHAFNCMPEMTPKLLELGPWLACTRKLPSYSIQAVPLLCSLVKANVDDVLSFPGELITSLRVLHYLCVPPHLPNGGKFKN